MFVCQLCLIMVVSDLQPLARPMGNSIRVNISICNAVLLLFGLKILIFRSFVLQIRKNRGYARLIEGIIDGSVCKFKVQL